MTELENTFISLVRIGIGNSIEISIPIQTDWNALTTISIRQGLAAVVLDGIGRLPERQRPPKTLMLQWIAQVLQSYERRFELYRKAIAEMAGFYNEHGLKMMVLKGYTCGQEWPRPEHRPCGDIDIWMFGKYNEADALLEKEKGVKIDNSHHHHTVFCWDGFMVENHYDFINLHHHQTHRSLEKTLKELGQDDTHYVELFGEKVYVPSPNLHALFLLRHSMLHFSFVGFSIRHLLDWAFFVKAHGDEVDWDWLQDVLEQHGMAPLFHLFNAICIEDLGFDASLFPKGKVDAALKERVLNEILSPEFNEEEPVRLIPRVGFKYRRFRANVWKHKLCYKESMWSAFWWGVWGHMLKPASI